MYAGALRALLLSNRLFPALPVPMTPEAAFQGGNLRPTTPIKEGVRVPIPMTPEEALPLPMTPGLYAVRAGLNPSTPPVRFNAPERRVRMPLRGFD